MANFKPMLSVEGVEELNRAEAGHNHKIKFPCAAEIKYDGFRVTILDGKPMSRTMKVIPNKYVQSCFATAFKREDMVGCFDGLDGELIALDPETGELLDLHRTQSAFNTVAGFPRFVFVVFDDVIHADLPFKQRREIVLNRVTNLKSRFPELAETNPNTRFKRIPDHVFQASGGIIAERLEDILAFEAEALSRGEEGIMLKSLTAKYKNGRSTLNEFASVKVKRFTDSEAVIIGFTEKMHNANEAVINAQGYTERSSAKDNLVPANTLGNLILEWQNPEGETITFEIGTGWDAETAKKIWMNRAEYYGDKVNFKYKGRGPNGKPLIPSFQGIRYDV